MKRKQILARAITLGLLLTMPVGGAMAADLTINSSNTGNLDAGWNPVGEEYYIYNTSSVTNNVITINSGEIKGNGWTVYGQRYNIESIPEDYVDEGYWNTEYYIDSNKKGEGANIYGAYAKKDSTIAVRGNQIIMNGGSTISGKVEKDIVRIKEVYTERNSDIEFTYYYDEPQTTFNTGSIIGGQSDGDGEVSGNTVTINDGTVANSAIGGQSNGTGMVSGNAVTLNNGIVNGQQALLGGYATLDSAVTGNKVTMSGGTVNGSIRGGYAYRSNYYATGGVTKNSVEITGGTVNGGGYIRGGESMTGAASENSVSIENATINGDNTNSIYGGYSVSGEVNKNTVSISNMDNLDADVTGGRTNGDAEASYNKVKLSNVTFNSVEHPNRTSFSAGGGSSEKGIAEGNELEVHNIILTGGLTGGNGNVANNNKVTVSGADTQIILASGTAGSSITGGSSKNKATGNIVTIEGGVITGNADSSIVAGRVNNFSPDVDYVTEENTVKINGGTVGVNIYGGYGLYGSAINNAVEISGGIIASKQIIGGMAERDGSVTNNNITISGGEFTADTEVIGGVANKFYKTQEVNISQNTITVTESANDLYNVSLYGAKTDSANAQLADNALVIDGWRGTVKTIVNVTDLNFEHVDLSAGGILSAVKDTDLTGVKIAVNSLKEGSDLAADGTAYTIIDGKNSKITIDDAQESAIENIDTTGTGVRVHDVNTTTSNNNLVANITKSVLANVYVDANGEETSNNLVIGENFSTNASVVAGAYASGANTATGGRVTISGDYTGDVYAGYSESGAVDANTITLQSGAAVGNLYGSNTEAAGSLVVEAGSSTAASVANFAGATLAEGSELTTGTVAVNTLTNDGKLTASDVTADTLTNSGKLNGESVNAGTITNSGTLEAKDLEADTLINSGTLTGASADAAALTNIGTLNISGNVKTDVLTNSGIADVGTLTMSDNSTIATNGGTLTANTIVADNLTINALNDTEKQVVATQLDGDNLTVKVNGLTENQVVIGTYTGESVSVIGSSSVTDNLGNDLTSIEAGMQNLADTLNIKSDSAVKELVAEKGSVLGKITGTVDANGNLTVTGEDVNSFNQGISEMASIALMTWRQENNDMNKRLGELRDSAGEHGVWVRMTRGESKYGNQNIKNQYNAYQLGYDEKLSVDKNWTVGAALTYTDANSSFSGGKGENKHKGIALYGSRLNDDGSFIDLIARYARLEHDFDVRGGAGKGDFDTNGYSLSAEYGKRFTGKSGLWLEPQVELTYGRVSSANYVTDRGVMVRQDDMDSLVGRLGFALGQNLAKGKGNVYLRASYLYDFEGETDARFMNATQQQRSFEQDLGGGWWEVGVGANINLSEATHLYFDVEKTYGGNVATPWQWNAGVRWSF